uniref:Uncharacterized protein n=1 Tax=Amphimedon queenslandica TaxID=400682 RepID=A0A1X7T7K9_AMPQE
MMGTTGFYSGRSTKSSCDRPRRVAVINDSVMYGPNEALVDRNDLSVSLDEFDDYKYDETSSFEGGSFESGLGTSFISTTILSSRVRSLVTSTPLCSQSSSYRTTQSAHISWRTRPNLLHSPPPTKVVMLQEQQGLLQKFLSEQEEMNKSVKRNNERISVLEAHINNSESSSSNSSSGEKRRLITKDLTDKVNKIHEALEEDFSQMK